FGIGMPDKADRADAPSGRRTPTCHNPTSSKFNEALVGRTHCRQAGWKTAQHRERTHPNRDRRKRGRTSRTARAWPRPAGGAATFPLTFPFDLAFRLPSALPLELPFRFVLALPFELPFRLVLTFHLEFGFQFAFHLIFHNL